MYDNEDTVSIACTTTKAYFVKLFVCDWCKSKISLINLALTIF